MKKHFIKWLTLTVTIISIAGLNSCVKSREGRTDFSNLQDFVIFQNGGLGNFTAASVATITDTVTLNAIVTLASRNVSTTPTNVTIGIDDAKRTDYNAANGTNYQKFPDSIYKFLTPTVTIPAGQNYATIKVQVFSKKVDPSVSYMLPLAITDASGKNLSGNENVLYYHIVGNPLAGAYLHSYYRWNGTSDTTTAPNSTVGTNVPIVISPVSSTSLLLPEYYLEANFGLGVVLSFSNNNGSFSNFKVFLDPATQKTLDDNNFKLTTLKLVSYTIVGDANTKYAGSVFRIYLEVINNAGALRTLINNFVKK